VARQPPQESCKVGLFRQMPHFTVILRYAQNDRNQDFAVLLPAAGNVRPSFQRFARLLSYQAMQPKFFYFDLGKVLVDFSLQRMVEQIAAAATIDADSAHAAVFGSRLIHQYEVGEIGDREFFESFCSTVGRRVDYDAMTAAVCDIFSVHLPTLPLVAQMRQAGYAMGILSNTCPLHWLHCLSNYRVVADAFSVRALSYEIGAAKPDAKIYCRAAELAGVPLEDIFFVDDIAENVHGAKAVGIDAVQFTTANKLAEDLRRRGVKFNY
jgi:glucose-1-phosphatase